MLEVLSQMIAVDDEGATRVYSFALSFSSSLLSLAAALAVLA